MGKAPRLCLPPPRASLAPGFITTDLYFRGTRTLHGRGSWTGPQSTLRGLSFSKTWHNPDTLSVPQLLNYSWQEAKEVKSEDHQCSISLTNPVHVIQIHKKWAAKKKRPSKAHGFLRPSHCSEESLPPWSAGSATVIWDTWWILFLPSWHSVSAMQKCSDWRDQTGIFTLSGTGARLSRPQVDALQLVGVLMRANYSIDFISQPASNKKCLVKLSAFSGFVSKGWCQNDLAEEMGSGLPNWIVISRSQSTDCL